MLDIPHIKGDVMDVTKLSKLLMIIGGIITLIALGWWGSFYGKGLRMGAKEALSCLYSSNGTCSFASGIAQLAGVTPYNPAVFWIGAVLFGVGLILFFSAKEEDEK